MKKILMTGESIKLKREFTQMGYSVENPRGILSEKQLINYLKDVEIYVLGGDENVTPKMIEESTNLKAIIFVGDQAETFFTENAYALAKEKGIPIYTTPKASTNAVAEMALAHMLTLNRETHYLYDRIRNGEWPDYESTELTGKTLGIIGMGAIGRVLSKKARGLEMNVIYWSRTRKSDLEKEGVQYKSLDNVLRESDVISIHAEYNDETHHFISKDEFGKMKEGAMLINVARPWIVDPQALYENLKSKKIKAGFDGWYTENISIEDQVGEMYVGKLWGIEDKSLLITSHQGYNTKETNQRLSIMIEDMIEAIISKKSEKQVHDIASESSHKAIATA